MNLNKSLKAKITIRIGIILFFAFGSIITSIIILGIIKNNMQKIADASPEFVGSMQVNKSMTKALYNLRGYLLTKDENDIEQAKKYFAEVQSGINELKKNGVKGSILDSLTTIMSEYIPEASQNEQMRVTLNDRLVEMEKYKKDFVKNVEQIRDAAANQPSSPEAINRVLVCDKVFQLENNNLLYKDDPEKIGKTVTDVMACVDKIKGFAPQLGQTTAMNQMLDNQAKFGELSYKYFELLKKFKASNLRIENMGDRILAHSEAIVEKSSNVVMSTLMTVGMSVVVGSLLMYISIAIVMVISILLGRRMINTIMNPISNAVDGFVDISKGDLTKKVPEMGEDELGIMAKKLNDMSQKLKDIVDNIVNGANSIYQSSSEMAHTSQMMSTGANQQASSAEEVSSSIEEMSASISQNSDNARQTEKIAQTALESIRMGTKASLQGMDAMKQIAEKITIVDDIAFQTNILALNAAVEAARAGEHGKGFAVVAAEVRKLAERSSKAASEIDVVSKEGLQIAEKAGSLLKNIIPDMEKTADLVREISAASSQQASGIEQINSAVQQLNEITQEYAASAEELASTSQNMAAQSETLKTAVAFFKTR